MKKFFSDIMELFDEKYSSFILLLLWTISPVIEYIFKNYYFALYKSYFHFVTYFIGILGIILYIVYYVKLKKKKQVEIKKFIPEILIIILLIISIIASILSENPHLSFFGEGYRKEGLIIYIMYIGILLLASIVRDSKYIKYLVQSIIISALIITILPLFRSDFTFVNYPNVFMQFNHYGYYLMINIMLVAFMFIKSEKIVSRFVYLLIFIFFSYLLIRNDTFGCFLAIAVTFFFLFLYSMIKKYQRMKVILIIIVFAITSFSVSHFDIKIGERVNFKSTQGLVGKNISTLTNDVANIVNKDDKGTEKAGTGRGLLWKGAINYTLDHPLFGGGMECLKAYYREVNINYNDRPHNIILQVSSFIGMPGAIVYISLIMYIAITNLKLLKHDTIHIMIYFTAMCYFISSIFGNSMYYTSPYFMVLLGLLIGYNRYKKYKLD